THAREQDVKPQGQSSLRIEVDPAQLLADEQDSESSAAPAVRADQSWTPVPVPAPVYTMKPAAPRREVEPVRTESDTATETPSIESAGSEADAAAGAPARAGSAASATSAASAASPEPAAQEPASAVDSRDRARARGELGDVDVSHAAAGGSAAPPVDLQEVLERRRAVGQ